MHGFQTVSEIQTLCKLEATQLSEIRLAHISDTVVFVFETLNFLSFLQTKLLFRVFSTKVSTILTRKPETAQKDAKCEMRLRPITHYTTCLVFSGFQVFLH